VNKSPGSNGRFLPLPCYDLTELHSSELAGPCWGERSPRLALIRATDSVNKSPGPTQRGMMNRAYETFLVHGRLPSGRSPLGA